MEVLSYKPITATGTDFALRSTCLPSLDLVVAKVYQLLVAIVYVRSLRS